MRALVSLYEANLWKLAQITEADIQDIWIETGPKLSPKELTTLVYSWDLPLCHKMIFRFRNCGIAGFWNQIDPCNRACLLRHVGIFSQEADTLMDFFAWIENHLSVYELQKIKSLSDHAERNGVQYFLESSFSYQQALLAYYARWVSEVGKIKS